MGAVQIAQIKKIVIAMGFGPLDGTNEIYAKNYSQHDNYIITVNFASERIIYTAPTVDETQRIIVGNETTSNFSKPENFVVLECVNRLLEKGYSPNCIKLEKIYPSGHGHSGNLDILVNTTNGNPFLMIECKTWGKEFDNEQSKMLKDGGQLFTYYKNATATKHLCLYTSRLVSGDFEFLNSIVDVQADWAILSETSDIYEHWNKQFRDNGIFESYTSPYNIVHKRLTYSTLKNMHDNDSGKIYNQIMEILRHNGVSDKPNAFNKLLNLFVCKIIDEDKNADDELDFQTWAGLTDEDLQMTLNDLYKQGMWRFLNIDVIDHSMDEVTEKLESLGNAAHKAAVLEMVKDLRLKKSPNFAFVEVLDDKTFKLNAKIVREIVELLQGYKFRYEQKHEFLGDFFEKLLNDSMKQEAGQFFTPVPITRFIISSLPIKNLVQSRIEHKISEPLPTVIDYACGSGHFLTEFMSQMQNIIETADVSKALPSVKRQFDSWRDNVKFSWAKDYVYGIDFDNRLVKTTKVSAFFNGDGEAIIVWGNGLDNFEHSEEYRDKLKRIQPNSKKDNGQFDILISNPPYSVAAFKSMLNCGAETFDLFDELTDSSSEIECLFVERMKQLLKVGGWAGIILPSSMLSNDGIYARTRDIIFKYFNVKAIVELGSKTFMKTGTHTNIIFLERRPDGEHENIARAITAFFVNKCDVTVLGIENAFSKFVANVYNGLTFEDYISFVSERANEAMKSHGLWRDYVKDFGETPYSKAFDVEQEKMLYFILTYNQNIVLAKSGQKQDEKAFLGYEFSERRGYEGMKHLPKGTMLFDENGDVTNLQKVNSYIYNAFLGNPPFDVTEAVEKHVSYGRMSSYFEYGTSKFSKRINLNKKGKIILFSSRFEIVQLGAIADIVKGQTITAAQTRPGNIPVVAGGIEPSVTHDVANRDADIITVSASGANAGYVRYWDTAIFASDCNTIKTNVANNAITKYLYICLKELQQQIFNLQVGQAQPHVYEKDLREITLPLPPLDIQRQIIIEWQSVTNEIEHIKANIAQLEEDVRSQFNKMFGDPMTNPKGWTTKRLDTLGTLKNGMNFNRADSGVSIKCLGVGDFQANTKIENMSSLSEISLNTMPQNDYLLRDGDIVFVRSNGNKELVGRSMIIYPGETPLTFSGFCIRLRLTNNTVNVNYLLHLLCHSSVKAEMFHKVHGANISNLNQKILSEIDIPLPPHELQNHFEDFVRATDKSKFELQQKIEALNKKYQSIWENYL